MSEDGDILEQQQDRAIDAAEISDCRKSQLSQELTKTLNPDNQ